MQARNMIQTMNRGPNCIASKVTFIIFMTLAIPGIMLAAAANAGNTDMLFSHFPDRAHAVVWRNWHAVEPERIAAVLETSVENVTAMAESMGLPPAVDIPQEQKTPGYFWMTLCRRNWHLLPIEQLAVLLDTTPEKITHFLRVEEQASWTILGGDKPECPVVKYVTPNAETQLRAAGIKAFVEKHFADELRRPGEPRFAFIHRLSQPKSGSDRRQPEDLSSSSPRLICSCLKVYGDPLMDPRVDMYPDWLLERLADQGVNGVWLYGVLQYLAPGGADFPEFGENYQTRQANLRTLVERAKRHGIDVYLYINEPRSQPNSFFAKRAEMAGSPNNRTGATCMCTSHPAVRQWISDALAHIFTNVPDLAGVFTITASENQTNCAWGGTPKGLCPRCKNRKDAGIYAELNSAIESGIHRAKPDAKMFVWDWGWPAQGTTAETISLLPKSAWLMSVSEWSLPIERGGIKTLVNEYSLSAVGPGPRSLQRWVLAKKAGLKTIAKVQLNNSWELSSLPYLPVLDLVAQHCQNLAAADVDGLMLSWTLGAYPSPNMRVAQLMMHKPTPSVDKVLDRVAGERFGSEGIASARKAWAAMSRAFQEYPYNVQVIYLGPMQLGPANLLYPRPTGLHATMVGFPFDDLNSWRGPYPAEVFASQFEKMAVGWEKGLAPLAEAVAKAPPQRRVEAREELSFAQAAQLYFRSVANQTRFIMARDALLAGKAASTEQSKNLVAARRALDDEIIVAADMFKLAKQNSCIGFEPACQYFYLPLDLVEKAVSCRLILDSYK
ncbi:MAG: hypothetical protein JXM70_27735 [Pirellulales bacterium]|nr:hypothetical protein [Pirellulales bacterium]